MPVGGYRGLHKVTGDYGRLHRVTELYYVTGFAEGYTKLQMVTRGCTRLQGVTQGYRHI